jgi:hypothetical protein
MKLFAGLTVWALPLAATASFLFGGLWYGVLAKRWMAASGLDADRIAAGGGQTPTLLALTWGAEFVMAWVLAGVLLHMAKSGLAIGVTAGLISAAMLWLGFVATTLIVNHRYQMQPWSLTVIDGGHWLGVLLIQGAILGRFGLA